MKKKRPRILYGYINANPIGVVLDVKEDSAG